MSTITKDVKAYLKLFEKYVPNFGHYAVTSLAISRLAKQASPRKCRKVSDRRYGGMIQTRVCPVCSSYINGIFDRYCSDCGQRVLREGEVE